MSKTSIRIMALQILLFGLLFLPDFASFPPSFGAGDASILLRTLALVMANPAFYGVLTISAIVFSFSFDFNVSKVTREDGTISVGDMLIRSLARVLILYVCIFIISWVFLTYKMMFMGEIYTNPHIILYFSGR